MYFFISKKQSIHLHIYWKWTLQVEEECLFGVHYLRLLLTLSTTIWKKRHSQRWWSSVSFVSLQKEHHSVSVSLQIYRLSLVYRILLFILYWNVRSKVSSDNWKVWLLILTHVSSSKTRFILMFHFVLLEILSGFNLSIKTHFVLSKFYTFILRSFPCSNHILHVLTASR